jgi:uncharacterized SAM-dependent methyltransferase
MFDLAAFDHSAPFVREMSRIEMHLVSRRRQTVRICLLDEVYTFEAGETINTENSHKYTPDAFRQLAGAAGLSVTRRWTDGRHWFGVSLLEPVG